MPASRPSRPDPASRPAAPADGAVERDRPNLTGRAAVLALIVCVLSISLAYPLREYLSQRSDIGELRSEVAAQEKRVAALERARERWKDPAYVEAQARERLHYVMPGETSYVVLGADEAPPVDGVVRKAPAEDDRHPWFTDLWHSVEAAGKE